MNKSKFKIIENKVIAKDVFRMVLEGDTTEITKPGQFVNIELDDLYLRRPISICDYDEKTITVIYKVVGQGTEKMSQLEKGKELDILTGLGNGFETCHSGEKPLIIGGGVGTPPMYRLCKDLISEGKKPTVILGFNSKEDIFYKEEFEKLGVEVYISTVDGSVGTKGFVTDVMKTISDFTYFYACGPIRMLKAVCDATNVAGEVSLEERMGCGFGACMGCTIQTKKGNKRVCREGPVFNKEDLIWK